MISITEFNFSFPGCNDFDIHIKQALIDLKAVKPTNTHTHY